MYNRFTLVPQKCCKIVGDSCDCISTSGKVLAVLKTVTVIVTTMLGVSSGNVGKTKEIS